MHLSTIENPWGKPFTNKRYIHPPFAETMVTMWPSSMIMFGEIKSGRSIRHRETEFSKFYVEPIEPSTGVIFTVKIDEQKWFRGCKHDWLGVEVPDHWNHGFMPMQETTYKTRRDGVPIHRFVKDLDAVKFYQEAFCDIERVPTAYIKIVLENGYGVEQSVELGGLVRSGGEFMLTGGMEADGYCKTEQQKERWLTLEKFNRQGRYLTNGVYRLYFEEEKNVKTDGEVDFVFPVILRPYEKKTFYFALTRNEAVPKAYAVIKKEVESFWKKELSKAQNIPNKKDVEPLFYNLLSQQLQMFCYPKGDDKLLVRQGGLQRYTWPESTFVLQSLAKIGGFSEYLDKALGESFNRTQEKEGENAGRIFEETVPWNSRTASVLESFAAAVLSERSFYKKYIQSAMMSFRYLERERAKTADGTHGVPGLVPPGINTDAHHKDSQEWAFADAKNLLGYKAMLEMAKAVDSEYLPEIQAAYDDYLSVLRDLLEKITEKQKGSGSLFVPRDPKNDVFEEDYRVDFFGYSIPYHLLGAGVAGYGTENAELIIKTYTGNGQSKNGLIYPVYRSTSGTGRSWYTSWGEFLLFSYYKECGNKEKQKQLLEAQLKYNVTNEYYQAERYDDHDAYTAPWLPNASANGRLLLMLFAFYGAKKLS